MTFPLRTLPHALGDREFIGTCLTPCSGDFSHVFRTDSENNRNGVILSIASSRCPFLTVLLPSLLPFFVQTKPDTAAGAGTAVHPQDALATGGDLRHAVRGVRVDPQTEGDGFHTPNVSPVVADMTWVGFCSLRRKGPPNIVLLEIPCVLSLDLVA